jgi:hypothetical protein
LQQDVTKYANESQSLRQVFQERLNEAAQLSAELSVQNSTVDRAISSPTQKRFSPGGSSAVRFRSVLGGESVVASGNSSAPQVAVLTTGPARQLSGSPSGSALQSGPAKPILSAPTGPSTGKSMLQSGPAKQVLISSPRGKGQRPSAGAVTATNGATSMPSSRSPASSAHTSLPHYPMMGPGTYPRTLPSPFRAGA